MLQESGTTGVLTVREIVDVFRAYYPAPLPAERAIAMAGLDAEAGVRIGALSGGQRQRLYFALAICGDPDVLFLDEPTVGMDVEARRAFVESIQTLAAAGKTIVFTTHYLREAEELARRIIVIDHGAVIADASPAELKARVPGRKITLVAARPLAPADLDGLPVRVLSRTAERASLLSHEPAAVLRELFRRGVDLVDLEVTGADLEEAFLALTRRPEGQA
jgi:ABC-2 type transport system ATP-binding protein